jgi:hypothetical protein
MCECDEFGECCRSCMILCEGDEPNESEIMDGFLPLEKESDLHKLQAVADDFVQEIITRI